MRLLAVETSTLTGSVALLEEERLIAEITLSVSLQHSERLMPAIEGLLRSAGSELREIDLFAAAVGPGSFTGLRVGIAAVQGLAAAAGKPTIGVSTLQALAANAAYFNGTIIPVLEARRGEVYVAAYRGGSLETIAGDQAIAREKLESWVQTLPEPRLGLGILGSGPLSIPRASSVGLLALRMRGQTDSHQPLLPRYLRSPD